MTMQYLFVLCIFAVSSLRYADGNCDHAEQKCFNGGVLIEDECSCPYGWSGDKCQNCEGRFIVNETEGMISIGSGCQHSSNCQWLIQPPDSLQNPTLKLTYIEAEGACDSQEFIVYDGAANNDPMLANFNGIVEPPLNGTSETSSGPALIMFQHQESQSTFQLYYQFSEASPSTNEPASHKCAGEWCSYSWSHMSDQGRGSAAIAHHADVLYVYGGFLFGHYQPDYHFYNINLNSNEINSLDSSTNLPPMRFGHTLTFYQDKLFIFGGITISDYQITNEIWSYDIITSQWSKMDTVDAPQLTGHSTHVVKCSTEDVLLVFFGYNPMLEYSNNVYQLDLSNNTWSILETSGAIPIGRFGHAATHDPIKNVVYVNGGYHGDNTDETNHLLEFDVESNEWRILTILKDEPRFMHSMSLLSDSLYIVGGRTSQETCQDLQEGIYSIEYNLEFTDPDKSPPHIYGHSSLSTNSSHLVLYGGFDSTMTSDVMATIFLFDMLNITSQEINDFINSEIPDCPSFNESLCAEFSTFCSWNETCETKECPTFYDDLCFVTCKQISSCFDCLSVASRCCSCQYDLRSCSYDPTNELPTNTSVCGDVNKARCAAATSCGGCASIDGCVWNNHKCKLGNQTFTCTDSCSGRSSCFNCTFDNECYWCDTTQTCIEKNTKNVFYPYDTCSNFITENQCDVDECSSNNDCDSCHNNMNCGWCNFDGTGAGRCVSGSAQGPYNASICENYQWDFATCEGCQCNGHSATCYGSSYNCTSCGDYTNGDRCSTCIQGYYGRPANDGQCDECECNEHADSCSSDDSEFGQCNCEVQGMTGKYCDECVVPRYSGSPAAVNGSCFYAIMLQVRYIFSLTESEYKDKINFDICPRRSANLRLTMAVDKNKDPYGRFDAVVTTNFSNVNYSESIFHQYRNEDYVVLVFKQETFRFNEDPLRCIRVYMQYDPPFYFSVLLLTHAGGWCRLQSTRIHHKKKDASASTD